jgi:hypothetical protein
MAAPATIDQSLGSAKLLKPIDVQRFARTAQTFERRSETSDGLVTVALWSVGGLALTLLVIWIGSGAEFLSLD